MIRQPVLYAILLVFPLFGASAQEPGLPVSFEQAVEMVNRDNKSIRIAEQGLDWAKSERQRLNSFWYPRISASGAYVHMANDIEVKESLSAFTDPVKDFIHSIDPGEQIISSLLNNLGSHSFSVPLAPRNVSTIDATVALPIFTGGKRIYAGRIGKSMVGAAEVNRKQVSADQQVLLVETYFGVRLGQKIVEVRQQTYDALEQHFQNALKLEATGMLTKTERLLFQVNRDEAKRELETAVKDLSVAQNAFKTLVQIETDENILPVSPLFINESLPALDYFKSLVGRDNYIVQGLGIQQDIQQNQIKIANSAYMPAIELFGKQTLYSSGIRKNLVPRSLIGVGFTWNLFDGLGREKQIRQAKINHRILTVEKEKAADDLTLAVDKFYNQTQTALDNVTALQTTVEMSREIVRARHKSFQEGMATPTEVIDAELLLSKVRVAILMAYYQFDTGLINLLAVCGIPESFDQYSRNGKDETSLTDRRTDAVNGTINN